MPSNGLLLCNMDIFDSSHPLSLSVCISVLKEFEIPYSINKMWMVLILDRGKTLWITAYLINKDDVCNKWMVCFDEKRKYFRKKYLLKKLNDQKALYVYAETVNSLWRTERKKMFWSASSLSAPILAYT